MLSAAIRVHTIGDSTMSDYDPAATDKRGWGTYLGVFFDPAFVTVNNRGKSGASTRSFYDQPALWPSVKQQMHAGDYVLIQFAHNDEKCNGMDALEYNAYLQAQGLPAITDTRGTCPNTTYKANLRRFIDETRALGCTPILIGPICRKYFEGNELRRNAMHDLGDKFSKLENGALYENQSVPADDHSMDYVRAMREVAQEMAVPYIDLTTATHDMYLHYGEAYCTASFFHTGDKTHTAATGAIMIARLAAQLLKDAGVLAEYIHPEAEVPAEPSAAAASVKQPSVAAGSRQLPTQLTLRNMCAANAKADFTDAQGNKVSMQRFHNSDDGTSKTAWPADEIDENAVRYIDIAVTAPADSAIRITSISMALSGSGTSKMSCHINTGFGDNFNDVQTIYEKVALPAQVLTPVTITPTQLTIPAGETLHIRILPWLNDEKTPRSGKYICLGNLLISGKVKGEK